MTTGTVAMAGEIVGQAADRSLDTPYPVTQDQVTSLHEHGWAKIPGLLSAEEAAKIRDTLLAIPSRDLLSGPDKPPMDPSVLMMHEAVAWTNPYLKSVATSPRLGGAVAALMQLPEAIFVQDISFFKPVGSIDTPYHQDFSYWPFDREGNVTFWIALEDMEPEMGVLSYLEDSHRMGPLGYIERRDIRDAYPKLRDAKVVGGQAMKAGDAQVHWGLTVHGSTKNMGTHRRSALALRYHRSDVVYTGLAHPHYDSFKLTPGKKFTESPNFWRVGPSGLIEGKPEEAAVDDTGGKNWGRS